MLAFLERTGAVAHALLYEMDTPFSQPAVLKTQHRRNKATISGTGSCHFGSERVSGFEEMRVPAAPSDGTGVPLKCLTDRWCQHRRWEKERGELQEKRKMFAQDVSRCRFLSAGYEVYAVWMRW